METFKLALQILYAFFEQPKQIDEIKQFLLTARRKDAKCKYPRLCIHPLFHHLSSMTKYLGKIILLLIINKYLFV